MNLTRPTTTTAEVLNVLINNKRVSILDFPYLSGFRTRVSDLRLKHGLNLLKEKKHRLNKFKNSYTFVVHILQKKDIKKAINIYNKINKK